MFVQSLWILVIPDIMWLLRRETNKKANSLRKNIYLAERESERRVAGAEPVSQKVARTGKDGTCGPLNAALGFCLKMVFTL